MYVIRKKKFGCVRSHVHFPKPIAVRLENLVTSHEWKILFVCMAATRFSFNLQLQSICGMTKTLIDHDSNRYLYLDRGHQSIINRFQFYDASGHLLKGFQSYHILYGRVKVCTSNKAAMEQ